MDWWIVQLKTPESASRDNIFSRWVSVCLVSCSFCLTQCERVAAADRPTLLSRPFIRTRAKSDLPPSPSDTSKASKDVSASTVHQVSQTVPGGAKSTSSTTADTSKLARFPIKAAEAAADFNNTHLDLYVGLDSQVSPIDLPAALHLAGMNSPQVLVAQQRVIAATARQQLAAAQALPNLNVGMNYDAHTGALQRASGVILQIQRSSLYLGAGANAVAAGTVNIPGLQYNLNVGETYFAYLVSRQQSDRFRAGGAAVRNDVMLQIATAYCDLVKSQGIRAIAVQARDDAAELARIAANYAKIGQGLPADAERAATELGRREAEVFAADAAMIEASARLGQILNLESSVRLQSSEDWVIPRSIVPDPIPLPELIAISLYQRPEVAERRAEVHAAMLELQSARLLLFSPQFIAGYSAGVFGGGGDVNANATGAARFGDFGGRNDQDLVLYWSIRNLGLANKALIKTATARLAATDFERTRKLNDIRGEVAAAYARTQANAAKLDVRHRAVISSQRGYQEDLTRAKAAEGHPIEVLDSLRLRAKSQQEYLDTITLYNQAQYELYVAIGQPPADLLIHTEPVPELPAPAEAK